MTPISGRAGAQFIPVMERSPVDPGPAADHAGELLRRLEASPYVHASRRDDHVLLRSALSGHTMGVLTLSTGVLAVDVAADQAAALRERHRGLRRTPRGVCLEVRDRTSRRTAVDLLHRLIGLQLYQPQARVASP